MRSNYMRYWTVIHSQYFCDLPGTHSSSVTDRYQNVILPFYNKSLSITAVCY